MAESIGASTPALDPEFRQKRKRAILSAWAGFAIDSYSIFIVVGTLLPALVYFQGDMSAEERSVFAGMTLAVTLLGRPLGALIFGHFADLIGRQRIGAITIFGFGTISLLIGCLPGAEQVGATVATSLLIGLRFIEGIFLGVLCVLGAGGVEKVLEIDLDDEEKAALHKSADAVRELWAATQKAMETPTPA